MIRFLYNCKVSVCLCVSITRESIKDGCMVLSLGISETFDVWRHIMNAKLSGEINQEFG